MSVEHRICDLPTIVEIAQYDRKGRDTRIMINGQPMIGWQYDEDGNINLYSKRIYDNKTNPSS